MGSKGLGLSLQERISYTYTLRLGYSRNSILYKKEKEKNRSYFLMSTIFQKKLNIIIYFFINDVVNLINLF